ncbi:MAG: hypothetical protein HYR55_02005 [Acidobacteria bacterium]|nr:hypothetical protein [Acidobacteriota bacterium]MBI3658569.1 hypothetical protein [Acidobacteriota bacterium]
MTSLCIAKRIVGLTLLGACLTLGYGRAGAEGGPSSSRFMSGPVLGYVFDEGRGVVRAILGIPGAAVMADVASTSERLAQAWISPRQDYALTEAATDRSLGVLTWDGEAVESRRLSGVAPRPDHVVLSAGGQAAALYYGAARRIELVSGLPKAPRREGEVDVSGLGAAVTALAIGEDGRRVLVGTVGPDGGMIYRISVGETGQPIAAVGQAAGIAFMPGETEALVADCAGQQVLRVRAVMGAATVERLAGEGEGVKYPVAATVSEDGQRVFIANGGDNSVTIVPLERGPGSQRSVRGRVTGLARLNGTSVYRLTDVGGGPLQILDGSGSEPRIVFVPAEAGGGALQVVDRADRRRPGAALGTCGRRY